MRKIITLCLTAGMLLGVATGASAIDFKAKGQWIFGFGAVDTGFAGHDGSDTFAAQQRVRLQIDAIASETLSGTVSFEMGDTTWGNGGSGGALGADGRIIELRNAYIDWYVPNTELNIRMGLQPLTLPNVAGGSAILDEQVAAVVASYKFNDMISLGAAWARPYNDNWVNEEDHGDSSNYLDNIDLFTVFMPIQGDGWKLTPWFMAGMIGTNAVASMAYGQANGNSSGYVASGVIPTYALSSAARFANTYGYSTGYVVDKVMDDNGYGTAIFAGLPVALNFGALNIAVDLNYGSVTGLGDYGDLNLNRHGFLAKALIEYKMDWGTPGIFGWYASGDDGDIENGSEMMPYLAPCGNFTSFIGDGNELGYSIYSGSNLGYDLMLNYSGTWGIGLQIADMSFVEDLSHTFRVAYWGGTNSTDMTKYVGNAFDGVGNSGFYLTTADYLLEFNLDTSYQIYENLEAIVQLGYIVNGVNGDAWDHAGNKNDEQRDAFKAALFFNYSF